MSHSVNQCFLLVALVGLLGCGGEPVAEDPPEQEPRPPIQTDRIEYQLQLSGMRYTVDMQTTYTNHGDQPVYFHRECGMADEPYR